MVVTSISNIYFVFTTKGEEFCGPKTLAGWHSRLDLPLVHSKLYLPLESMSL